MVTQLFAVGHIAWMAWTFDLLVFQRRRYNLPSTQFLLRGGRRSNLLPDASRRSTVASL
jgi:hypothetical protein